MPSLDWWQAIGIVCGAILALAAVLRLAVKGARGMFRLFRKMSELVDQLLGDEKKPSMMELLQKTMAISEDNQARLARIEQRLADHVDDGHSHVNGPTPLPFPRGRRR